MKSSESKILAKTLYLNHDRKKLKLNALILKLRKNKEFKRFEKKNRLLITTRTSTEWSKNIQSSIHLRQSITPVVLENFCSSPGGNFPSSQAARYDDISGMVRIVATSLPVGDSLFSASRSHPSSQPPSPQPSRPSSSSSSSFIARGTRTETRKTRLRAGISIQPLLPPPPFATPPPPDRHRTALSDFAWPAYNNFSNPPTGNRD